MPRLAENLPYFGKHMDLSVAYNMEEGTMETYTVRVLELDRSVHTPCLGRVSEHG